MLNIIIPKNGKRKIFIIVNILTILILKNGLAQDTPNTNPNFVRTNILLTRGLEQWYFEYTRHTKNLISNGFSFGFDNFYNESYERRSKFISIKRLYTLGEFGDQNGLLVGPYLKFKKRNLHNYFQKGLSTIYLPDRERKFEASSIVLGGEIRFQGKIYNNLYSGFQLNTGIGQLIKYERFVGSKPLNQHLDLNFYVHLGLRF